MTGHASATSAHAAVHSIPKYKKETAVPFLYLKRDTNTGGAEVSLSWNMFSWNTGNLLYPLELQKNRIDNNWKLWCVESELDERKYSGIIFV